MAIISQETWDNMPQEEKEQLRQQYLHLLDVSENDENWTTRMCAGSEKDSLIKVFGKENFRLVPKIKTWEDVKTVNNLSMQEYENSFDERSVEFYNEEPKLYNKLIATYKIAKLIELGYGGMVTEEEYILNEHSTDDDFWSIWMNGKGEIECTKVENCRELLTFHTREQAEDFMSYSENIKLIKQYFMI